MCPTQDCSTRLSPKPLPANIRGAQPGGGWVVRLELAWGRVRRRLLRFMRPGYVARMQTLRRGECPGCPHDVLDPRDLKFCGNVCGHWFPAADDPQLQLLMQTGTRLRGGNSVVARYRA
jgi:hypothetical protein